MKSVDEEEVKCAIDLYRELHSDNMRHSMLTAIEALVRERDLANRCLSDSLSRENGYAKKAACYEGALGRIAGADFKDNGSAANAIALAALEPL